MGTERLYKTKEWEEGEEEDGTVGMKQPGWAASREREVDHWEDGEMSMETWGSQEGQGATWMYCSDMMELELIMDV